MLVQKLIELRTHQKQNKTEVYPKHQKDNCCQTAVLYEMDVL